jgi:alkylation response protein AidB-like acyl-CoA dehydrogenase
MLQVNAGGAGVIQVLVRCCYDALPAANTGIRLMDFTLPDELRMLRETCKGEQILIVMAVSDPSKSSRGGITAFLVDQGTKGMSTPTVFSTIGEHAPYGVYFDSVEVSDGQVLGEVGNGFGPMQNRLGVRRMEIACRALEYISRASRVFRIYEGPSEVHRWFIARDLLRNGMPAE